ncbi:MAG TPA: GNAT family N-acetyltransferase [Ktedonobacteraceae bacterium]|jgi:GNAT superfamily N-acetyltransferase
MQEVNIRPVVLSDAPELAPLMEQLGYPTTASEMEQRLKNILPQSDYHALVAICDGHMVGMIGLCVRWGYQANDLRGEIIALVIEQEYRSRGVGARLVAAGEHWFQERGASRIIVGSGNWRPDAHRFYERLGYQATGVRFVKTMS